MSRIQHGGSGSAYEHKGCRCEECKAANTARVARRRAEPKAADDPRHGKYSFYVNHGCRCEQCKAAAKAENKRVYDKRKGVLA